jgi:Uma2 family endonuclease
MSQTRPSANLTTTATWKDFIELPDHDRRELIDGVLLETEMPTELHEYIVARLLIFIGAWADKTGAGHVLGSGYKVRITARRGFMPDLQFYRKSNTAAVRTPPGLVRGHPDLVVEVISEGSGRYDRMTKLLGYGAIGVPEYWLVDQFSKTLERLVLKGGHYVVTEVLGEADTLKPRSFSGLSIPLRKLFDLPASRR